MRCLMRGFLVVVYLIALSFMLTGAYLAARCQAAADVTSEVCYIFR